MIDPHFDMITSFWKGYFEAGEEIRQKRKDKFEGILKGYLPVSSLKYCESPYAITLCDDDGPLVSVTTISEDEGVMFPTKVDGYTLLTVERLNGCYSALYSKG